MKAIKKVMLMLCALLVVSACSYDDEEIWSKVNDHEARILALEDWQKQVNNNITALQELLNTQDYITKVSPLVENGVEVGYTIEFAKSEPITLYHGKKGESGDAGNTPIISLTKEKDGNWYWTLNGELMKDEKGNPIRANGLDGKDGEDGKDGADGEDGKDGHNGSTGATGPAGRPAPTPQVSLGSKLSDNANVGNETTIDDSAVYLSVDGGSTWYRISGEKGSSGSAGEDNQGITVTIHQEEGYVTFTLENGTTFDVPLVSEGSSTGFIIYDKENPATLENNNAITIEIEHSTIYWAEQFYFKYPNGLKREDVSSVVAEIIGQTEDNLSNAPDNNFATRAVDGDKKIGVFVDTDDDLEGPNYYIYIKHKGMASGDTYMIRATLTKNDGSTLVTTRAIRFMEPMKVGDILYDDLSYSTTLIEGKNPVGIIFYLSKDDKTNRLANTAEAKALGKTPTGLVLALKDATLANNKIYHNNAGIPSNWGKYKEYSDQFLWCTGTLNEGSKDGLIYDVNENLTGETSLTDCINNGETCYNDFSGLANCQVIWNGQGQYGDVENYPAFNAAKHYNEANPAPDNTTGWFMPSAAQWLEMIQGLAGITIKENLADFTLLENYHLYLYDKSEEDHIVAHPECFEDDECPIEKINTYLKKVNNQLGISDLQHKVTYWTSSEADDDNAITVEMHHDWNNSVHISFADKNYFDYTGGRNANPVRCILAF